MPRVKAGNPRRNLVGDVGKPPEEKFWSYSYRFWSQRKYFGVGQVSNKWFVSLLEKLKDLSKIKVSDLLENHALQGKWRFHKLDWDAKNCPITRADLSLPKPYDNDDEYPIWQFEVSQALGRVIGFIEGQTFHIVLLDPQHNAQPSNYNDYKLKPTVVESSYYASLRIELDRLRERAGCSSTCSVAKDLRGLIEREHPKSGLALVLSIDPSDLDEVEKLLADGQIKSFHDVWEFGILSIFDRKS